MTPYRIEIRPQARKQLAALPRASRIRVAKAIELLALDPRPHGCKKLAGRENQWRLRVGDYRILYTVRDRELLVLVVEVVPRDKAYRRL